MKKITITLLLMLGFALSSQAQRVQLDASGNFVEVRDSTEKTPPKLTGKTFKDASGKVWPVWVSAKGKFFIIRTSRNGTTYKQYLKSTNN